MGGGQDLFLPRDLPFPHLDRRGLSTVDRRGRVWGLKGLAAGVRGLLGVWGGGGSGREGWVGSRKERWVGTTLWLAASRRKTPQTRPNSLRQKAPHNPQCHDQGWNGLPQTASVKDSCYGSLASADTC